MRGQGGSPQPQPLAWEHANGSGRGITTDLPTTGNPTTVCNPSASDLSAAEGNPSDRHPRSRSRGKRHRREAPSSSSKRRKTSHSPDWRSSSSSSESEEAELRGTAAASRLLLFFLASLSSSLLRSCSLLGATLGLAIPFVSFRWYSFGWCLCSSLGCPAIIAMVSQ